MSNQLENETPPADAPIVGAVTFVMNGTAVSMSFNAFADAVVRSAIGRIRDEIEKATCPKTPEQLALDIVRKATPVGVEARSFGETPSEFLFRESVHNKSRTRAALFASIILSRGPIPTKRLFYASRKFADLASVKAQQTAYDYAAILARCGIVEDVGRGCRGARWVIRKGCGIASNSDIARAIDRVDDDTWAKNMNKEHAAGGRR